MKRRLAFFIAVLVVLPVEHASAQQTMLLLPDNREGWPWGMVAHHLLVQHEAESTTALSDLGAPWVRTDFLWYDIERVQGQFDWAVMDRLVDTARARGYLIYGNLSYTPQWATDGTQITGVPRSPRHFRDFAAAAVGRFKDRVRHWGIWNEPESPDRFWAGTPQQFVDYIVKPGSEAIRAADPPALVLGPDSGDDDWLDSFFKAGGGQYLDVITVHVYACCDDTDNVAKVLKRVDCTGAWPWDQCRKRTIDDNGLSNKPVWLTEVGWKTQTADWEQKQAAYYAQLLDEMRKRSSWWKKTIFYELYDADACDPGKDNCWGIIRPDWSRKPAFDALKNYVVAHQPRSEAGQDLVVSAGVPAAFDGSGSRDPDGQIVKYRWDFDRADGVVEEAQGVKVSHAYPAPGEFVATLVVTDNDGIEDADTVKVSVSGAPDTGTFDGAIPDAGVQDTGSADAGYSPDVGLADMGGSGDIGETDASYPGDSGVLRDSIGADDAPDENDGGGEGHDSGGAADDVAFEPADHGRGGVPELSDEPGGCSCAVLRL